MYRDRGIASVAKRTDWNEERKAHERETWMKGYANASAGLAERRRQIEGDRARIAAALAAMSAEERQQRAVIRELSTMPGDRQPMFVSEEQGGYPLATLDKKVFEGGRDSVRIVVVYWRWTAKDTNKTEMIRQFKERFNFKAVREMLGN
jgi:hypothetical protein